MRFCLKIQICISRRELSNILDIILVENRNVIIDQHLLGFVNVVNSENNISSKAFGGCKSVNILDIYVLFGKEVDHIKQRANAVVKLCGNYLGCVDYQIVAEDLDSLWSVRSDHAKNTEILCVRNAQRADSESGVGNRLYDLDQLSGLIVDLNLKYDKIFSVIDIDEQTYLKWRNVSPFYQNVDREGIVLWKAA